MNKLRLSLLLLALPAFALAQQVNVSVVQQAGEAGVDYLGMIMDSVNSFLDVKGTVLVPDGLLLTAFVGAFKMFWSLGKSLYDMLRSEHNVWMFDWMHFFSVLFWVLICTVVLESWGVLHTIPTLVSRYFTNKFDLALLGDFLQSVIKWMTAVQKPAQVRDAYGVDIYLFVLLVMSLIDGILFVVNAFGFVMDAILVVFAPVVMPLAMSRRLSSKWWNLHDKLWAYAMIRAVSAAYTMIWTSFLMAFFQGTLAGKFGLGQLLGLIPALVPITLAFIWGVFKIPTITSEIVGTSVHLGQQFSDGLTRGARYLSA